MPFEVTQKFSLAGPVTSRGSHWGKLLRNELEEMDRVPRTVWINAWRHEEHGMACLG